VIPVQRSTLNHWLGSPNKLWEALAAGVPVVVSDFPEMRRVVLGDAGLPLGGTCDPTSPASIAHAIRTVTGRPGAERDDLRARCLQAAHERWNWETEATALLALYEDVAAARTARVADSAAPGTAG
jgi:glycosyltransferase involved in cell wall biosynthesis